MKKEELSLAGPAVTELMLAVHKKGAAFRFKAAGLSMTPTIRNNDVITISPLKDIAPSVGEVVAFRHPQTSRLIIHRVVRKARGTFFIRGDRLRFIDPNIPPENILGVVTAVERQGCSIYWPDRFCRPFWAKLYFRGFLYWLKLRRLLKFFKPRRTRRKDGEKTVGQCVSRSVKDKKQFGTNEGKW